MINYTPIVKRINFIVRSNHLDYNQFQNIIKRVRKDCDLKKNKRQGGVKPHLSHEEAMLIINYAYTLKGNVGMLLKVLLFTMTRVSEFINIKLEDVDLYGKKIYLSTTKGDKPRYVPIFDFYLQELVTYIKGLNRQTGYLFESVRNNKYSDRRIQQLVKKVAKDSGVEKKVHPHMLRRTCATWLREKGMSKDDIQLLLGHSSVKTTEVYTSGAVRSLGDNASRLLIE